MAVIEQREVVGGTCINTGTIPSKTMREAALHLSGFQYQGIYGVGYHVKDKITVADLAFRVKQVIRADAAVTQAQLTRNGVELINGRAVFVDRTHLQVKNLQGAGGFRSAGHYYRHRHQAGRLARRSGERP